MLALPVDDAAKRQKTSSVAEGRVAASASTSADMQALIRLLRNAADTPSAALSAIHSPLLRLPAGLWSKIWECIFEGAGSTSVP